MNLLQIQQTANDLGTAAAETVTQPTEFKLSILELAKIENALAAIEAGVKRVIITLSTAINGNSGTVIQA